MRPLSLIELGGLNAMPVDADGADGKLYPLVLIRQ
jgi:hypothetical protein